MYRASRCANGLDFARAGDALELRLQCMRDAFEFLRRQCLVAPQRDSEYWNVVDALRLDDRRQGAELARQPVLVRVENLIQPHQRIGACHAHLELHRQHGHSRSRDRIGVFDPSDLTEHLFGRPGDHILDVGAACAGKRDQHIGHRDVDLWLLLARRHEYREQA